MSVLVARPGSRGSRVYLLHLLHEASLLVRQTKLTTLASLALVFSAIAVAFIIIILATTAESYNNSKASG